jgi:hypothetical protein
MAKKDMYEAFAITPGVGKNSEKSYWNKVGVAFFNNDGSINVKLFATPINGEIQIRKYIPKEEAFSDE